MGKQKKSQDGKYVRVAIIFICCFIGIIVISLAWKIFVLYSQSRFDGKSEFVLGLGSTNTTANIIVFLPGASKINDVYIEGGGDVQKVADILNIPLDQTLKTRFIEKNKLPNFWNLKLNVFDQLKLWLFTRFVKNDQIVFDSVSLSQLPENAEAILPLFIDKTLYQEGQTIEIVNAGGTLGQGGQVGKLLSNIGANVISITTADNVQNKTKIQYAENNSYTVKRLESIFRVKAEKFPKEEQSTIADIIVTIGSNFK